MNRDINLEKAGEDLQKAAISFLQSRKSIFLSLIVVVIVILGFEIILKSFNVPTWIVPPPSLIAKKFYFNFKHILFDIGITLMEIIIGYIVGAIVGISLAVIFTRWPIFDTLFTPYILLMVATPMIALVPLMMLWLGFSPLTKIIAVVMGTFPVILINSGLGFKSTSLQRIAIAKSLGANEGQVFRFIRFPSALPSIFTGLIIGGLFAIITAVGAEFAGGGAGLGNRILYYSALVDTPMMYGIIIFLAIMGVSIYLSISYISQKVTKWH